ncbi:hypothetical protein ACJMK2_004260 [Sinanodonta woodiana]|uniref:EF-hand domain-containing protein n=1 Tax=Sinanodonta woodiana TaxID=1069815 RepID=A0ABD3Y2D0_SINWO
MKASVVCMLFASLLLIVLVRDNEGRRLNKNQDVEAIQRKYFNKYDENKDGYVSLHEFRITGSIDGFGEHIDFLFGVLDKDGDNKLNFEEFKEFAPTTEKESK